MAVTVFNAKGREADYVLAWINGKSHPPSLDVLDLLVGNLSRDFKESIQVGRHS